MEINISDMLDGLQVNTVNIRAQSRGSSTRIKSLTMNRVRRNELPHGSALGRRAVVALVLAAMMMLSTTVLATTQIFAEPTEPTFGTPIPFEVTTYEYTGPWILSGALEFTVTGARAVTHKDDIPKRGFIVGGDDYVSLGEGWNEFYQYPQFVTEDGSFLEGAFVILVDLTVTNHNAVSSWNDGTIRLYNFIVLSELKMNRTWKISFYSENEDPRAILELAPGETKEITVGFMVGDNWDGSTRDLSGLALAIQLDASRRLKIPLGLSNYDFMSDKEDGA